VERWLVACVARLVQLKPADIDVEQPFADFGLTSMAAVEMTGELEEWLGRPLPATLAWDFRNIASLARFLAQPGDSASGASLGASGQ